MTTTRQPEPHEDQNVRWLDVQIEANKQKRERAAILGLKGEYNHFDFLVDQLRDRRARYVREHNLEADAESA